MKYNIGRTVVYHGTDYIFSGLVVRSSSNGFIYQAELTDTRAQSSLLFVRLSEIEEKEK